MLRPDIDSVKEMIGKRVFIIHDNQITPTVVSRTSVTFTFDGIGDEKYVQVIGTSIGEFDKEEVFTSKEALLEHIEDVCT